MSVWPRDPTTLAGSVIVLAAVAAVAGWVPARRASRIDPAQRSSVSHRSTTAIEVTK
jgi:hypothetical protein